MIISHLSLRRIIRYCSIIGCFITILLQSFLLNTTLIIHYGRGLYSLYITDALIIVCLAVSFYKTFVVAENKTGSLIAFTAWCIYALTISVKVAIIFLRIAPNLNTEMHYGPNVLKTAVAMTSFVFIEFVLTHKRITSPIEDKAFYRCVGFISVDILDTVDILEVIFITESHVFLTYMMHKSIVVLSCINLVLPSIPLLILYRKRFNTQVSSEIVETLHIFLYTMVVNIPIMVIRINLWSVHSQNISVFLLKNVIHLSFVAHTLYANVLRILETRAQNRELSPSAIPLNVIDDKSQTSPH